MNDVLHSFAVPKEEGLRDGGGLKRATDEFVTKTTDFLGEANSGFCLWEDLDRSCWPAEEGKGLSHKHFDRLMADNQWKCGGRPPTNCLLPWERRTRDLDAAELLWKLLGGVAAEAPGGSCCGRAWG
uniref:Uncharacterized protein n=1 Tax=Globodera rostochiensis TaxID=31243 RepID=A0A914HMK8_GLORO